MSDTNDIVIHTIAAKTWTRYEKWRVELELYDQPKRICWLTPAQYDYLVSAFAHTQNGYSDKFATVIGTFSADAGHYRQCRAVRQAPITKHYTPLIDLGTVNVDDELVDIPQNDHV